MMKKVLTLALFFGLLTPLMASAQPKIGYMSSQKVMQNLPQRKSMQKQLSQFAKQQNKKFTKQATSYQKALSKFKKNKSSMSKSEIKATKKKLAKMKASLNKLRSKLRQKLQQKQSKLINPLLQTIDDAIVAVAQKYNLDFVLNKSIGGTGSVIYYASDSQMNITQEVINYVKSNTQE